MGSVDRCRDFSMNYVDVNDGHFARSVRKAPFTTEHLVEVPQGNLELLPTHSISENSLTDRNLENTSREPPPRDVLRNGT